MGDAEGKGFEAWGGSRVAEREWMGKDGA